MSKETISNPKTSINWDGWRDRGRDASSEIGVSWVHSGHIARRCAVSEDQTRPDILGHEENYFHNARNHVSKSFLRVWRFHPSPVRGFC